MVNFRCGPSPAFLAGMVGALEDVLAPFASEGRAEIPAISGMMIESGTLDRHKGSFGKGNSREPLLDFIPLLSDSVKGDGGPLPHILSGGYRTSTVSPIANCLGERRHRRLAGRR